VKPFRLLVDIEGSSSVSDKKGENVTAAYTPARTPS
jgi:hypothetical protein